MSRSIIAVVIAFTCMSLMVIVGTLAATTALAPGGELSSTYLAANLIVSLAAAMIGGAVVVRLAPRRPLLHAGILAAAIILLTLAGGFEAAPGQPSHYPAVVLLVGLAGIGLGALWVNARRRRVA